MMIFYEEEEGEGSVPQQRPSCAPISIALAAIIIFTTIITVITITIIFITVIATIIIIIVS